MLWGKDTEPIRVSAISSGHILSVAKISVLGKVSAGGNMPSNAPRFEIDDTKSFDANVAAFCESLVADDSALADILKTELPKLLRGEINREAFWNTLHAAAVERAP